MSASGDAERDLLGRGSIYTVATAVQMSSGLLVLPFATRVLGPREYGALAAAMVVVQLLTIIATAGIAGGVARVYFLPEHGRDAPQRLIGGVAIAAAIVTTIAMATSPIWLRVFAELRGQHLVLATLATAGFLGVVRAAQGLLRARKQAWLFTAVAVVSSTLGQVVGLGFAVLASPTASWFVTGMLVGSVAGAALGLAITGIARPTMRLVRWSASFGLPTIPHSLSLYVVQAGDRVVIERILGLAALGSYHVAYLIASLPFVLVGALNQAWAPIIYAASDDDRTTVLRETSASVHRVAAYLVCGVALLSPVALRIAAPPEISEVDGLLLVMAVIAFATMFQVSYLSQVHLLFQHQRTRPLAVITPAVAIANVLGNLWLVPRFGLLAAAITTGASYALQAEIIRRVSRRLEQVSWAHSSQAVSYLIAIAGCTAGAALPGDGAGLATRFVLASMVAVIGTRLLLRLWRGRGLR